MGKPARPHLHFDTVDAMLADVDQLRAGYAKAGNWTLEMALDHLAKVMSPPPGRTLPWPMAAVARRVLHWMAGRRTYPTIVTFPALPSQRPDPTMDADAAYRRFRDVAEQGKRLPTDVAPFPPIGDVPTADYLGLHLLHAAHHLSFLRPTN